MMRRLRAVALRARGVPGDDEGLTLLYVMVFIMLITSLIFFLMAQILTEARQTLFDRKHTQTLNSASAGLQAATNLIRNAIDPVTGVGLLTALPCQGTNKGTVAGPVDSAGALTYSADIYYLSTDPSAMTQAQVIAAAMTCGQVLAAVPAYAYILSSGTQAGVPGLGSNLGNRALHAIYAFSTTNAAGVGGQVTYTNYAGVKVCWDAGSSPAAGNIVYFQACGPAGTVSQSWYYRPDLTVQWMGDPSRNLCLQRSGTVFLLLPLIDAITLQPCVGSGTLGKAYDPISDAYTPASLQLQEFPTQDSWAIANSDGSRNDSWCITSFGFLTGFSVGAAGDRLVLAPALDCIAATSGAARAAATSQVGAGAASGVTNGLPGVTQQIANLGYANRCLDVRNADTTLAAPLLVYICGQSPDYTLVPGNKRFQFVPSSGDPTRGQLLTLSNTPSQAAKCFEPSGTVVRTLTCVTGRAQQVWNLTGYVAGDYPNSYTIRDYLGRCLTALVPNERYDTIAPTDLETCTGADTQKWNAPPGGSQTQLTDIQEP